MGNNQTQPALNVHSYESMGTYDGPGLRLVVFLQGCNFKCLYCANPDTIDSHGGKPTEAEEIVRMAVSQKAFFGRRGGITFSGGEPTFQAKALIPLCRELLSLVDLVLLDVKEFDNSRHRNLTGRGNEQTLRTAAWLEAHGKPFWLRYVLVPGYSDAEGDIRQLGEHFRDYRMLQKVEILPYHTLGVHKYEALGQEYRLKGVRENTTEQLERAERLFREYFDCVQVN